MLQWAILIVKSMFKLLIDRSKESIVSFHVGSRVIFYWRQDAALLALSLNVQFGS